MIRLILALGSAVIFLLPFGIPAALVLWIIGKFSPYRKDRISLTLVQGELRIMQFFSGVKFTVEGKENLPDPKQAVLYVSNHRSYFDIIIGYTIVPGLTGFVAKQELGRVPFLHRAMVMVHCVFLDRKDLRGGLKSILAATENVKNGISMWICPEGTRNHTDELLPFKEGSFKIAEKTGCPVVPVTFIHTDDIFENHFPYVRPTHVTVRIGEPIQVAEMSRAEKKALCGMVREQIQTAYNEMIAEEKAAENV